MKTYTRVSLFITLLFIFITQSKAQLVTITDEGCPMTYWIDPSTSQVEHSALSMMLSDIAEVSTMQPKLSSAGEARVVIYTLNRKNAKAISALGIAPESLQGKKNAFCMKAVLGDSDEQNQLAIVGSDNLGTAYGMLELSRMAGVSPWREWGGAIPQKHKRFEVQGKINILQSPSVEFRGIFINDEDWSLRPWAEGLEPSLAKGTIGPAAYELICKLLLRLRANTLWPAMHPGTTPFYLTEGVSQIASKYGITIGTSHCEPLMRNNVGEWSVEQRGPFNFITNRESVLSYWNERLQQTKNDRCIYTLGMRGIHDGSMEGVSTLEEKTTALQQVIDAQRQLLSKSVNKNLSSVPQQFVPYKEVLDIYRNGLRVPDDVMLTWCDDNYGYITHLPTASEQERAGGNGLYYHLSYWGRPHDYLWLGTTQPGLIRQQLTSAYDNGVRRQWIVNVHDPKATAYQLELFLDMAWNIESVKRTTPKEHLDNWLCREVGYYAAKHLLPAVTEAIRLNTIRRPEFMGWSQTEVNGFPRRLTPVSGTDFSSTEMGGELQRRLNDFDRICLTLDSARAEVTLECASSFFLFVDYPLRSAAAMNRKWLYAQLASSSTDSALVRHSCHEADAAYKEITRLTSEYNSLSGGKWRGSMNMNPRDLPVFAAPSLPLTSTADAVCALPKVKDDSTYVLFDVQDKSANIGLKAIPHPMLGHSMNALEIPKTTILHYEFRVRQEGPANIILAFIPTHPIDDDLRVKVSLDGRELQTISLKEPFRSERWKENVLRQQALRTITVPLSKGYHAIYIEALDRGIILDQMMVDFKPGRKFYEIPVNKRTLNFKMQKVFRPANELFDEL